MAASFGPIPFPNLIARYSTTAGQSIPNTTTTIINFDTQTFDSASLVSTGVAWKLTVPTNGAGRWEVLSSIIIGITAANSINLYLYKNGSLYSRLDRVIGVGTDTSSVGDGDFVQCVAGDTLDIRIVQASIAAQTLSTTAGDCHVTMRLVGR